MVWNHSPWFKPWARFKPWAMLKPWAIMGSNQLKLLGDGFGIFFCYVLKVNITNKMPIATLGFIKILGMFENIKPN